MVYRTVIKVSRGQQRSCLASYLDPIKIIIDVWLVKSPSSSGRNEGGGGVRGLTPPQMCKKVCKF